MKKAELKKILKPLIQECVKEAMFEEGVLSSIITEVARGMASPSPAPAPTVTESPTAAERIKRNAFSIEQTTKLQEHKKKLMAAIGGQAYNGVNLFEGTAPAASTTSTQGSPLAGQETADPGVDITNLLGSVASHWTAHMSDVKDRK